jgi:flagellar motor protein MotB
MGAPIALASRELVLAQARALARHGRHAEAEDLLAEARDDTDPSVAFLDLLARVHAQQGHLDEADECWAEAERLAPGNKEATGGRRRIARIRAGVRGSGRVVPRAAAGAGVVLALALLVDTRIEVGRRPEARTAPSRTAPAGTAPAGGQVACSPDDVLSALDLRVPGVHVRRLPGEISVTFAKGLFRDGVTLSPDGRAVLRALGARLRPYGMRVSVDVIGRTDRLAVPPGSAYAGNAELGTMRATVVREVLREAAGIPTSRFSVSSLGGVTSPSHGSAARNRTASLRISAAGEG